MNLAQLFIQELKGYREPRWGLLGDGFKPKDPSGNSLLYESHAAWIWSDLMRYEFKRPHKEFHRVVGLLEGNRDGTFYRKPPEAFRDDQSHDDYTGVASAFGFYAFQIAIRGTFKGWFYDSWRPEVGFWQAVKEILTRKKSISYLKFWHARLPGQIQHYKISANQSPSHLGWLLWLGSIVWTTRRQGNESGWLLDYLKLRVALHYFPENIYVRIANKWFIRQLNKYYFGNINRVYAVYFGAEHPLARYSSWPTKP